MLTILGKPTSINVRKVLWTCAEIGLPYQHDPAPDPLLLARLNPNALVPVLRDGDAVLWESNTICRYLANVHGRDDLLPSAPMARAQVEKWMDWQATDWNSAWRYAFMALVRKRPGYNDATAIAASVTEWNKAVGILDAQLQASGHYVCGAQFTLADVVAGVSLTRWMATPIERPPLPAVADYLALLAQREGFRLYGADQPA